MDHPFSQKLLKLSNDKIFYTLEGEGEFIGQPSVFMRLSQCNLTCPGFKSEDSPHGCDSYISWSVTNKMTFHDIRRQLLEDTGYMNRLRGGAILKITGGEPLLWKKQISQFIDYLVETWGFTFKIDFETNGTIIPDANFTFKHGATYTVSPKLESSGNPRDKRYNPDALRALVDLHAGFKFVVQNDGDIEEIKRDFLRDDIGIRLDRVWLMPCCGSRDEQSERAEWVAEKCKELGVKFSPRLQLLIWDKALLV